MKNFLFTLIILLSVSFVYGQIRIQHDQGELILTKIYSPDSIIYFDTPISKGDSPGVILFKQYFNPGTLEAYKKFFLPQDWMNATHEQFSAWQSRIKKKRMRLSHILHIETSGGDAFLIIQYVMEDDAFIIPGSSEFKWVQNAWMHTSLQNDALGPVLSRIGDYDPEYYTSALSGRTTHQIKLQDVDPNLTWQVQEKFDRDTLFELLKPLLEAHKMTTEEIEMQRNIFRQKDDRFFVENLSLEFQIDDIAFMDAANEAMGFRLFNYSQPQKN